MTEGKTQEKLMKTDSLSCALLPTSWLTAMRGDEQSPRETVADFLWCSVARILGPVLASLRWREVSSQLAGHHPPPLYR